MTDNDHLESYFAAARRHPPLPAPLLEEAIVAAATPPATVVTWPAAAGLAAALLLGLAAGAAVPDLWASADWTVLDTASFDPDAFVIALEGY